MALRVIKSMGKPPFRMHDLKVGEFARLSTSVGYGGPHGWGGTIVARDMNDKFVFFGNDTLKLQVFTKEHCSSNYECELLPPGTQMEI